jgi:hypothetical protein
MTGIYFMLQPDLSIINIKHLFIYRIAAVMKIETDVIASIATSLIERAVVLVLMYVQTFKLTLLFLLVVS